jgi:hypothetical protein
MQDDRITMKEVRSLNRKLNYDKGCIICGKKTYLPLALTCVEHTMRKFVCSIIDCRNTVTMNVDEFEAFSRLRTFPMLPFYCFKHEPLMTKEKIAKDIGHTCYFDMEMAQGVKIREEAFDERLPTFIALKRCYGCEKSHPTGLETPLADAIYGSDNENSSSSSE